MRIGSRYIKIVNLIWLSETFVRDGILFSSRAKTHGMREFLLISDRLSRACPMRIANALGAFLTPLERKRTIVQRSLSIFVLLLISHSVWATPVIEIEIRNHLFFPSEIEIPAGQKVKLVIINKDNSAEEFESYELNREKVIPGNSKGVVFIGPLKTGRYPFFGEFFPKTAQGVIHVK